MIWSDLLINMLINDLLANKLVVFIRKSIRVYGLLLADASGLGLLMVNISRVHGFMGHDSLENVM